MISVDPCRSCSPKHQSTVYTANIFKAAAGVSWFLTPLKGEVLDGLSWEGVMPAEHVHWGCSDRHSLSLSSEIHSLCLQSLSSLSAIAEPVTVVSFVTPDPFYRTSLYNGQLRPSRRLHIAVK